MRSIAGSSDRPTSHARYLPVPSSGVRHICQSNSITILIASSNSHRQTPRPTLIRCPYRHRSSHPSRGRIINPATRPPHAASLEKLLLHSPPCSQRPVSHARCWQGQHRATASETKGKLGGAPKERGLFRDGGGKIS